MKMGKKLFLVHAYKVTKGEKYNEIFDNLMGPRDIRFGNHWHEMK
jgi:hypothetical protein